MITQDGDRVLSEHPVGTLERVEKIGLKRSQWGSCSRPEKDFDGTILNVGCRSWKGCKLAEKGTDKGFCHLGLRVTRKLNNGRMDTLHMTVNCEDAPERIKAYETAGMVVQIVARDGEIIKIRGSKNDDRDIPGEGKRRFVVQQIVDWEIPKRLQPDENPELLDQQLGAQIAQETMDKRRADVVEAANLQNKVPKK